jgi:hypothetical protein
MVVFVTGKRADRRHKGWQLLIVVPFLFRGQESTFDISIRVRTAIIPHDFDNLRSHGTEYINYVLEWLSRVGASYPVRY